MGSEMCIRDSIMNYATAAGIENKDHWIEPHLPDLDRDIKEEVGIDFD